MQNTAAVNIEIKSTPALNKASDLSNNNSNEEKAATPFGETLSAEINKADSEHKPVELKKAPSKKAAETAEPVDKKSAEKAESKQAKDGKELPVSKQVTDSSVATETVIVENSEKVVTLTDEDSAVDTAESEQIVTQAVASAKPAEPKLDSDKPALEKAEKPQQAQTNSVKAAITSEDAEKQTPNTPLKTTTEKEQLKTTDKPLPKSVEIVSAAEPKQTVEASSVSEDEVKTNQPQPNTATNNHAQLAEKELVIKQINIAKETSAKTDISTNNPVVTVSSQKNVINEGVNRVKPTLTGSSLISDLVTESEQKPLKVTNPGTLKTDGLQIKQVVTDEAILTGQRETVILDKKLVEIVEPNLARSSSVDNKTAVSVAPLTSLSGPITQTTTSPAITPVLDIQPALKTEAWERVMAGRVVWMAREGLQRADLKLTPANLGPVEVRLTINNDQANVTFVAQNPATREALEQSLPRLREGFQANGLSLANADVSDQTLSQDQGEYQQTGSGILFGQDMDDEEQLDDALVVENEEPSGLSLYV